MADLDTSELALRRWDGLVPMISLLSVVIVVMWPVGDCTVMDTDCGCSPRNGRMAASAFVNVCAFEGAVIDPVSSGLSDWESVTCSVRGDPTYAGGEGLPARWPRDPSEAMSASCA